jgi:Ni,Fe-hydrogenase III small subunit/ferredoxin-like protein FixX
MIKTILTRLKQGHRTLKYPVDTAMLSDRYLGRPEISDKIEKEISPEKLNEFIENCPVNALSKNNKNLCLNMGKCIFCGKCSAELDSPVHFTKNYCISCFNKNDLVICKTLPAQPDITNEAPFKNIFRKSLILRQVSAGGCNACEADINVLNTLSFDLGRFGISFAASPRHADGLIVTGPVTEKMKPALEKVYNAMAEPKIVIAAGACAISGGIYENHDETKGPLDSILPVDLYIPGCPPHPLTILAGLLKIMKRD